MLVAFCDQLFGNSTSSCSNAMRSPWPMRASRVSHSTVSNGCTPGVVKYRLMDSALPGWTSSVRAVCAVYSMKAILSRQPQFAGFLRLFERVLRVTADHPLRVGRNPSGEAPVLPQLYGGRPSGPAGGRGHFHGECGFSRGWTPVVGGVKVDRAMTLSSDAASSRTACA